MACEADASMADVATEVLCGRQPAVRLHSCDSKDMTGSHFDVAVMEVFDAGLLGEGVVSTLKHALDTLRVSRVVPCKATVYVAAVECPYLANQVRVSGGNVSCDLEREPYDCVKLDRLPGGYRLLADPAALATIDFESKKDIDELFDSGRVVHLGLTINKGGSFDCLALWFAL